VNQVIKWWLSSSNLDQHYPIILFLDFCAITNIS